MSGAGRERAELGRRVERSNDEIAEALRAIDVGLNFEIHSIDDGPSGGKELRQRMIGWRQGIEWMLGYKGKSDFLDLQRQIVAQRQK